MEWSNFNTHGESANHAFEVMCNILFKAWCKSEYKESLKFFSFVNGSGGDGGVEAYAVLKSGDIIGVQSKWFPTRIEETQFKQIRKSFYTAVKVRPKIQKYIVCIPRNLTSDKNVKGGKVAKNTEECQWLELVESFKETNPTVTVELWDETTILEKMLMPEATGCYKYWFENTDIFDTEIIEAYTKAINGWAKPKYIPDLYSAGFIHDKLEHFAGSYSSISEKHNKVKKTITSLQALKQSYKELLMLEFPDKEQILVNKINTDIAILDEWIERFENMESVIAEGVELEEQFLNERLRLNCSITELKECSLYFHNYFHFDAVFRTLRGIEKDTFACCQFLISDSDNRLILLGNQGTGKTAGIVSEIDRMLQGHTHLPILVRAKEFATGDNWLSILLKTLELPATWSIRELLKAMENAALLRNKSARNELQVNIQPKCLICVDGIDEAANWQFWQERIDEAKIYESDFPNIRFVFLSRPYVFPDYYKTDYRLCFHMLPSFGDVPVSSLFNDYMDYYEIDLCGNMWIKGMLKTPMALKLFCDIYRGMRIESLPKNSVVITKLFEKKIKCIEDEYRRLGKERCSQSMVLAVLITVATLLVEKKELSYEEIYAACKEPIKSHLEDLLCFVEKEGFIYSKQTQKDPFSMPETIYSWGMQPAFEYLIARKLYDAIKEGKAIEHEYGTGIYQMLALIMLEEDHKLIFDYPQLNLDKHIIFDLVCYSLANATASIAGEHYDYVKRLMKYSVAEFREIFYRIIIPSSNVLGHPLGSPLLDEFLRDFDKPAKRDIWWSIPAYLHDNYDADWRCYQDIDTTDLTLTNGEHPLGLPLIIAWNLSSVDNEIRYACRLKLTEWGINNSEQFYELFVYCADINDEQIIEDIFSIAYGIALDRSVLREYLEKMSAWLMDNVFSEEGLAKYENVAVRYYSIGIVKRAISKELCDKRFESAILPPYQYKAKIMHAAEEAFDAKRMSGYGPIDYDFSRYVLCDCLDRFFRTDYERQEYSIEATQFIEEYGQAYDIEGVEPDGIIISTVYQYLLDQGWDKKTFFELEDKHNIGVDVAIRRTFHPATHGSQTKIMSVSEKYIWCARHRLEAVLANRIMSQDFGEDASYISDYLQLENFTNTHQDYINTKQTLDEETWMHTEQMVLPKKNGFSIENIEVWMTDESVPDFSVWLGEQDGERIFYAYTNLTNELEGLEETIWISSGAVNESDFDSFVEALNVYSDGRNVLVNVAEFHAYQDCRCYCTPQEACTVQSDREVEGSIYIGEDCNPVEVYKLVTESTTSHAEDTERTFYLPSKLTRELVGVDYGDGYQYLNEGGDVIARCISAGENWKNQQKCLLLNSEILDKAISDNKYAIFWLLRVQRGPTHRAYELFRDKIMFNIDRSFLVWYNGEEYKWEELKNIEPPVSSMTDYETLISKFCYKRSKDESVKEDLL